VIALTALFLYLFLTRNTLLDRVPFLPQRNPVPVFLYYLDDQGLNAPVGVATDDLDYIYITDTRNSRVVVFNNNGFKLRDFGQNHLDRPVSVSILKGSVYVADLALQRIQVFTSQGTFRETLVASGENKDVGVFIPTAVTVDDEKGLLFFTDAAWHRVVVLDRDGNFRFSFGSSGSGQGEFLYPNGIVLDTNKNIYVADSNNGRIQVFSPDGKEVIRVITGSGKQGGTFALPRGMAVDKSGRLWVVDSLAHNVSVFDDERKLFSFGKLGTEQGEFYFPNTVALDSVGRIYVTERGMNRVSVFTLSGNPLAR